MADSRLRSGYQQKRSSMQEQELRTIFIQQLKSKYKEMYEKVPLAPFTNARVHCVDKVFVGGGVELLVFGGDRGGEKWEPLNSYHDILKDSPTQSTRRVLEGKAGMGKSTLTLQLVYDWCNKTEGSYLHDIEMVILLPLRKLKAISSVAKAVKLLLLHEDSQLEERDIENILNNCSSVVVILDGFDEYPDQDRESNVISHLLQMIFQQFDVVVTTRYMPSEFALKSKRFRLTGFDEASRNEYIGKVIACEDEEDAERIRAILRKNVVLDELCNVPMFFAMFVQLAHESAEFATIRTVTEFFSIVMKSVHKHLEGKVKGTKELPSSLSQDYQVLSELAFEGLIKEEKQTCWQKEEMTRRIGSRHYHDYLRMGILVEEEVYKTDERPGSSASSTIKTTQVKFYHALFNEWFAAQHLSQLAARPDVTLDLRDGTYKQLLRSREEDMLRHLDPVENEYIFRFASGLNSEAAYKLDRYMTTRYGGDQYAMLCVLEQTEKTDKVLKAIEKMGTTPVMFHEEHKRLHQRATVKLLQIAANEEYPISSVWIYNCFRSVDVAANAIFMTSGITFPTLKTLMCLEFRENRKAFSESEVIAIVNFSSRCLSLKTLKFVYCLMPRFTQIASLEVLRERNVKVLWDNDFGSPLQMDLDSGEWLNERGPLTDADYQYEVDLFHKMLSTSTSQQS